MEEFIPIKKRASLDCDEEEEDVDDEDEQHLYKPKISKDNNKKSDWLRSVQLWHPDPPTEEKMYVIEVKRSGSGGAFQPFHKEEKKAGKTSESFSKAPSSTPVAAASSTVVTVTRDNSGSSKREEKDGQRKQRRCWSQELHKSASCRPFSSVVVQIATATPKQIREQMKVDGLTNDEIKSHLQ